MWDSFAEGSQWRQSRHSVLSLHGRLEVKGGSGFTEASSRRTLALDTAFFMQRDRASFMEAIRATNFQVRKGFGKVD